MRTVHKMRISLPDNNNKDECIETLIDNILARFPDAEVLSAPVDVGEENINGHQHRWIEQSFTSKSFDDIAERVIEMMIGELFEMKQSLSDEDSPFGGVQADYISSVINAIIDHISFKFLEEEYDKP